MISPFSFVSFCWRSRWGILRLTLALVVLWTLVAGTAARLARLELASLPDFDALAEIEHLRTTGRYGEAIIVADAVLSSASGEKLAEVTAKREVVIQERDSLLRRVADFGLGAISGHGRSLEGYIGAIGADLLIVGDIRDLLIQGARAATDGDADEVIVLLSAVGIVTTVAPEIDWAPSLLKIARRAGAMTEPMAQTLKNLFKSRDGPALNRIFADTSRIATHAGAGGTVRLMRLADTPKDLARISRFVSEHPRGAFVLHVTGGDGLAFMKEGDRIAESARAAAIMDRAAVKGAAGVSFLRSPAARVLLKPHFIVGLVKGVWKGNVAGAVERLIDALDGSVRWLLPLCATWAFIEAGLLMLRWRSRPPSRMATPAQPALHGANA